MSSSFLFLSTIKPAEVNVAWFLQAGVISSLWTHSAPAAVRFHHLENYVIPEHGGKALSHLDIEQTNKQK